MSGTRRATHANSWYSGNRTNLNAQLTSWLDAVQPDEQGEDGNDEPFEPPIRGCKAIIAPHAGYDYSGPTAAWAYKCIDTTGIKRVFILGPSHHVYLDTCALTRFQTYATPLGPLPVDLETTAQLRALGTFSDMSTRTDEKEHSIELHLPYVRKVFEGREISIVPILIGAIDERKEQAYGRALAPYLAAEDTMFVISSDFCHWGERFNYTYYYRSPSTSTTGSRRGTSLSAEGPPSGGQPIHVSISQLDHEAMSLLTIPSSSSPSETSPPQGARQAHAAFAAYLRRTGNTICGRHPIGVLLGAIAALEEGEAKGKMQFVRYAQSSACEDMEDSSVSYASAYATVTGTA